METQAIEHPSTLTEFLEGDYESYEFVGGKINSDGSSEDYSWRYCSRDINPIGQLCKGTSVRETIRMQKRYSP